MIQYVRGRIGEDRDTILDMGRIPDYAARFPLPSTPFQVEDTPERWQVPYGSITAGGVFKPIVPIVSEGNDPGKQASKRSPEYSPNTDDDGRPELKRSKQCKGVSHPATSPGEIDAKRQRLMLERNEGFRYSDESHEVYNLRIRLGHPPTEGEITTELQRLERRRSTEERGNDPGKQASKRSPEYSPNTDDDGRPELKRSKQCKGVTTVINSESVTPPPGASAALAPNAPMADAGRKCHLWEPNLRGGIVSLANGTSMEQIGISTDMRSMPDDGFMPPRTPPAVAAEVKAEDRVLANAAAELTT
jgi:hypothetical protein